MLNIAKVNSYVNTAYHWEEHLSHDHLMDRLQNNKISMNLGSKDQKYQSKGVRCFKAVCKKLGK